MRRTAGVGWKRSTRERAAGVVRCICHGQDGRGRLGARGKARPGNSQQDTAGKTRHGQDARSSADTAGKTRHGIFGTTGTGQAGKTRRGRQAALGSETHG